MMQGPRFTVWGVRCGVSGSGFRVSHLITMPCRSSWSPKDNPKPALSNWRLRFRVSHIVRGSRSTISHVLPHVRYVYIYLSISLSFYPSIYLSICIYVYMYMYMYMYMYVYIYIYIHLSIYLHMYLCMYVFMYVCMYACMYVCIYLSIYLSPDLGRGVEERDVTAREVDLRRQRESV